jgi:hypothetical protein
MTVGRSSARDLRAALQAAGARGRTFTAAVFIFLPYAFDLIECRSRDLMDGLHARDLVDRGGDASAEFRDGVRFQNGI